MFKQLKIDGTIMKGELSTTNSEHPAIRVLEANLFSGIGGVNIPKQEDDGSVKNCTFGNNISHCTFINMNNTIINGGCSGMVISDIHNSRINARGARDSIVEHVYDSDVDISAATTTASYNTETAPRTTPTSATASDMVRDIAEEDAPPAAKKPREFKSAYGIGILDKCHKLGLLDKDYQPLDILEPYEIALLADKLGELLHIDNKWKKIGDYWGKDNNNLRVTAAKYKKPNNGNFYKKYTKFKTKFLTKIY